MQNFGTETRASLHLADGPEQIARDTLFATRSNPDRWNDAASQQYLWSFDAEREAQGSAYGTRPSVFKQLLLLAN